MILFSIQQLMPSLKNALLFYFCFRKLWMPFNVPNVGNCFVFNHLNNIEKDSSSGRRQSAFPGPFTGLKIVLDLEIDEYIKGALTESSGAVSLIQVLTIDNTFL